VTVYGADAAFHRCARRRNPVNTCGCQSGARFPDATALDRQADGDLRRRLYVVAGGGRELFLAALPGARPVRPSVRLSFDSRLRDPMVPADRASQQCPGTASPRVLERIGGPIRPAVTVSGCQGRRAVSYGPMQAASALSGGGRPAAATPTYGGYLSQVKHIPSYFTLQSMDCLFLFLRD
jgi:hypothetical protein